MAENDKTESNSLLHQRIRRGNFIRAAALEWMRINQSDLMAQIEAEAERQYPFTKRSLPVPAASPSTDRPNVIIDVPRPQHGVWMADISPGDPLPPLPSNGFNGHKQE
jgi:hypothetical protein